MRRLFVLAFVILAACGGDRILDPVQTVDGTWNGASGGIQLSLAMTQSDTLVSGNVAIAGISGSFLGTLSGSFKYPDLNLALQFPGANEPVIYTGTMSTTQAKISGRLNGSGFGNFNLDVAKR
jgi:hypothetical protein